MSSLPNLSFNSLIEIAAARFSAAGAVDVELAQAHPIWARDTARYREWIEAGAHADMQYLARGLKRRTTIDGGPRGALVVLDAYSPRPWGDGVSGPKIARYARGPDYHKGLASRLNELIQEWAREHEVPFKVCVDTSAVLERTWAQLAGLGWIGKNSLLIHPRLGSYTTIGVAFVGLAGAPPPSPLSDRCGSCRRCQVACPTKAIPRPGWIESRRCISYATLESRASQVDLSTAPWVAGCDVCQETCPFNWKVARTVSNTPEATHWADFESLSGEELAQRWQGTALSRIKPNAWVRNLSATKKSMCTTPPVSLMPRETESPLAAPS